VLELRIGGCGVECFVELVERGDEGFGDVLIVIWFEMVWDG